MSVRKIESLYMQDAERQVKAAQMNVQTDYKGLNQLRGDYESLKDNVGLNYIYVELFFLILLSNTGKTINEKFPLLFKG